MRKTTRGAKGSGLKAKLAGKAKGAKADTLRIADRMEGRVRGATSTSARTATLRSGSTTGTLRTGRRATPALAKALPVATGRRTAATVSTRTAAAATTTGGSRRKAGRGGAGATVMRPHEGPNATPSRSSPRTIKPLLSGKSMRVR